MTKDESPKNKGGRPRKNPVGTRVPTLAFRVRAGLRDRLEENATRNERSISEEIESRLESSFDEQEVVGGDHTRALLRFIGSAIRLIEQAHDGRSWMADADVAAACRGALDAALNGFMKTPTAVQKGLLGALSMSQHEEERQQGRLLGLRMLRERLRRQMARSGADKAALEQELAQVEGQIRRIEEPTIEPLPDLSHIGKLQGLGGLGGGSVADEPSLLSALMSGEATPAEQPKKPGRRRK